MKISSCLTPDRLRSLDVSTKKGGAGSFSNQPRSISASSVEPSGPHAGARVALMHGMGMQQQCCGGKTMKRLTQIALVGIFLLAGASQAAAQARPPAPAAGEPQPVVRLGNFIEVGNDVWMHLLATTDVRYTTVENQDFERRVRDRAAGRAPDNTAAQISESDGNW